MEFRSGELVKCIDDNGMDHLITRGKVYTVKSYTNAFDSYVTLEEVINCQFRPKRFISMEMQSTSPYCNWEMKWKLYGLHV